MFVDYHQTNWPEWLAISKFSYNNRFQSATRVSPFYANYRDNPHMGFEPRRNLKVQAVEDFVQQMKNVQMEVEVALHKAHNAMLIVHMLRHPSIKLVIESGLAPRICIHCNHLGN